MADEVAQQALQLAFREPGPVIVNFYGGEPMQEFAALARWTRVASRWARRRGRAVEFQATLNATILSDSILRFLRHYRYRVGFTVGALEGVEDQRPFEAGGPSPQTIWENLERATGLPGSGLLMVVSPETLPGLSTALRRLQGMGYRQARLTPHYNRRWTIEARELAREVYAELHRWSRATGFSLWGKAAPCGFGRGDVAIAPSGNIYPCCRLVGADTREDLRIGAVGEGLDPNRVARVRGRARVLADGLVVAGCPCRLMGSAVRELEVENAEFFRTIMPEEG